jgi:parallel beta-helix repeat protein
MKKIAVVLVITVVLASIFALALDVRHVRASGTIYLRADGSIDPLTAPIQRDGDVYSFSDNVYDWIVVERSNIIIDGNGYTLQGLGSGYGFYLSGISNATIKNTNIKGFVYGVAFNSASHNVLSGNNITNNEQLGISLYESSDNSISGNNIANNTSVDAMTSGIGLGLSNGNVISGNNITNNYYWGVSLHLSSNNSIVGNCIAANKDYGVYLTGDSSNNDIYHNNFNNSRQVYSYNSTNTWDDGYLSGGNYWSNYNGFDLWSGSGQNLSGSDGIGDTSFVIDATNQDHYPLKGSSNILNAGTWNGSLYSVNAVSNSTVSDLYFNPEEGASLRFNVTGETGTGFCKVAIPKQLLWVESGEWQVLVDGVPVTPTTTEDADCTYLYFTYSVHSTLNVEILGTNTIPEFSSLLMLICTIVTSLAVIVYRRKGAR